MAMERVPLAFVLSPIAIEACPLAIEPDPIAVDQAPLAVVLAPMVVDRVPLAVVLAPIAVEPFPLAIALNPNATAKLPDAVFEGCPISAAPPPVTSTNKEPDIFVFPITVNVCVGLVVFTPTLPPMITMILLVVMLNSGAVTLLLLKLIPTELVPLTFIA